MARRIAQIVHLKPSAVAAYKDCHANVWPEILQQIHDCNIRDCKNYHHFHRPVDIFSTSFFSRAALMFVRLNFLRQRQDPLCHIQIHWQRLGRWYAQDESQSQSAGMVDHDWWDARKPESRIDGQHGSTNVVVEAVGGSFLYWVIFSQLIKRGMCQLI